MHPRPLRIAVLAILAWTALAAPPAFAHAIIVEASPAVDAVIHGTVVTIRLRFNSRIDHARSRLTVIDSTGKSTVVGLAKDTEPDMLAASLTGIRPGAYRLRWQVLAVDGHITRGDIPFTVVAP